MTNELRQLIKQRNRLQGQILNGDTNAETEKKFRKLRNKIGKHAKVLKGNKRKIHLIIHVSMDFLLAKYENSISGTSEPSLAPPSNSQQQSTAAAAAANHPLSTILDPALVMAMLVNPSLYSHVQQQVLSSPNFIQAYQHMFAEGNSTASLPPKVASETQVVPSTTTTPKATKEQQQQNVLSARSRPVLTQATKPIQLTSLESDFDNEQRNKTKPRFNPSDTTLTESQQQDIALTQELIRRQLALTQQQQRNQRNNPHAASQISLSTPLSRHIPLTTEQMQEVLTRAKNYVTRQQSDETTDSTNTQPRLSYNTRRLQAALAASASSATPQTAHTIGQAAAAAIAAVSARPPPLSTTGTTTAMTKPAPAPSNTVVTPTAPIPPSPQQQQQQQHPIRIQLDQKSKTLSSISNNQSSPIPTINQQKLMPLVDVHPSPPPHMYPNQPNWQRPPHLPVSHYPMPPHQQQYPPYDNPHAPPYYGPRPNYLPDMRPPSYGPLPPRHLSQPPRYNGPLPPPGPYGYGHPPQNYGPPPLHPHPHYGHHYPPP
jgi:hypothetical protein